MSAKVEVLCPNGHRVNVKITPNTKVLQILEEACTKKGFTPPSDFELKHGRKALDVTLTVRYAGLPNNAKLELVKATQTRTESDVMIALQLAEGQRLQGNFTPQASVWEVLKQFESRASSGSNHLTSSRLPGHHPVCVYMREEVVGAYALQQTSLRDLGLTGGKAILRLNFKHVSAQGLEEIKENIDKEKERQAKMLSQAQEQQKGDSQLAQDTAQNGQSSGSSSMVSMTRTGDASQRPEPMDVDVSERVQSSSPEKTAQKNKKPKKSDAGTSQQPADSEEDVLMSTPWSFDRNPAAAAQAETASLVAEREQLLREQQETRDLAQAMFASMSDERGSGASTSSANAAPAPQFPFSDFKFPEASKGKNLYKNEFTEVSREDFQPCPRETVVFTPNDPELTRELLQVRTQDLPDDFFEVKESDVKKMWVDLQKKVQDEVDQPLLTQSLRRMQREEYMERYERVAIRVHFPDRFVLQGLFRPRENVLSLYKYVEQHLAQPKLNFYLYTTPPKNILKEKGQTLIEAHLTPMSNVYFGSSKLDHYLSEPALQLQAGALDADKVLVNFMNSGQSSRTHSRGKNADDQTARAMAIIMGSASTSSSQAQSRQGPRNAAPTTGEGTSRGTASESTPVPKWFKVGKK